MKPRHKRMALVVAGVAVVAIAATLILKAFINTVGMYPAGTVALLDTNEIAVVVEPSPHDIFRPKVKIVRDRDRKEAHGPVLDLNARDEESGAYVASIVSALNRGRTMHGGDTGGSAGFTLGVAFNPNFRTMTGQVRKLRQKVEAGAQFALTQLVYDVQRIAESPEATGPCGINSRGMAGPVRWATCCRSGTGSSG